MDKDKRISIKTTITDTIGGDFMKAEAIFEYLSVNGKLEKSVDSSVFEQITGPAIYEVIRVANGSPMFLDDHLDRMFKSADLAEFNFNLTREDIHKYVVELISINHIIDNNIKLLSSFAESDESIFLVYAVESFYPPESYYLEGIKTILF